MFCPRCETDYGDGPIECPRCGNRLLAVLPQGESGDREDLVPVFETADNALLPVIKSLLEAAEIPYMVQGDHVMGILPLGRFGIGVRRGVLGAVIHVPRERAKEARDLLHTTQAPSDSGPEESS